MQQYRLLRNNRETGPHSQQDLIDLGLKAYDLIWMEGSSSSWKYPSEVDSLKCYAPPATEDFYVLFHTQPSHHSATTIPKSKSSSSDTVSKPGSRKYVTVILPTNREPSPVALATKSPQAPVDSILTESWNEQTADPMLVDSRIAVTNIISYKSKQRYLVAASFLVLLATGIYFGTNSKISKRGLPETTEPLAGSLVSLTSPITNQNENLNSIDEIPVLKPNLTLDFAAVKRHVQVKFSEYSVGFFGGISGLELTVTNKGKIKLNNVVIAVDFLEKNKTILHTENIAIPLIEPGRTLIIPVKDNPQGIAIQTRIIGVNDLFPF